MRTFQICAGSGGVSPEEKKKNKRVLKKKKKKISLLLVFCFFSFCLCCLCVFLSMVTMTRWHCINSSSLLYTFLLLLLSLSTMMEPIHASSSNHQQCQDCIFQERYPLSCNAILSASQFTGSCCSLSNAMDGKACMLQVSNGWCHVSIAGMNE